MRQKNETIRLIALLLGLFLLAAVVDNAISRRTGETSPEIKQDWDKTAKAKMIAGLKEIKNFKRPRLSISIRPLSAIYFFSFNHGAPAWLAMVLAYLPLPIILALASFLAGKRRWRTAREKRLSRTMAIGIFFLLSAFIVYKAVRQQFDENFFLFAIAIFIPAALGSLSAEKRASLKVKKG